MAPIISGRNNANSNTNRESVMYKIVRKKNLNPTVTQMEIEAPLVAAKAKPGQFIILRVDENGERIPLTVAVSYTHLTLPTRS